MRGGVDIIFYRGKTRFREGIYSEEDAFEFRDTMTGLKIAKNRLVRKYYIKYIDKQHANTKTSI